MSGSFSTALEINLLNHVFGCIVYPSPTAVFIALFTSAPTADGGGTEVTGGAYVRMAAAFGPVTGAPPLMTNPAPIQWAAAQAPWGTLVAGGLFDAVTGGNFLGGAMLVDPSDGVTPQPKDIGSGDVFRIPLGNLIVGFAPPVPPTLGLARTVVRPIAAVATRARGRGNRSAAPRRPAA